MKFKGLTNIGKRHLANIHANNKTLEFTKIKFGDGTLRANENPEDFTNLKNFKTEKEILNAQQDENICSILAVIDNLSLTYGYHVREFGIYVKDNDREILYYYMNDDNEASWLPPASDGPHKMEIKINMVMSNTTSVTVNTTSNDLYLTNEYFLEKLAEKENVISNKKSGFNLDKTDEYNLDNTNKLATARALKLLFDEIIRRIGAIKLTWNSITGKPNISSSVTSTSESDLANSKAVKLANDNANSRVSKSGNEDVRGVKSFLNNTYFKNLMAVSDNENLWNQNTRVTLGANNNDGFLEYRKDNSVKGTLRMLQDGKLTYNNNEVMLINDLVKSLGLEYAGLITQSGQKTVGKAYWHSASKKLYKCIRATTATSPAVNDFIPVDNNSILDRLENLPKKQIKLLWQSSTGIDQEDLYLNQSYLDFDEIIFVSDGSRNTSGYYCEWRYSTRSIIQNKTFCNSTFGYVMVTFKSNIKLYYDGTHQFLSKVYGLKY